MTKYTRPSIGFLTYASRGPVWAGCAEAARSRDANLVGLAGWWLEDPSEYRGQANVLYDLAAMGRLDGLVVWSSALGTYVGQETTRRFCERFRGMPIVSMGMELLGAPSVLVNEAQGIRQLMAHLVETHGSRRIACISGPAQHPDLAIRERAYHDALQAYNLPFDQQLLVRISDTNQDTNEQALHLLLQQDGPPLDAILVARGNDVPTVMQALHAQNLRVPHDIIVVSFGQSFQTTLPLTAAAYPFYEQGRRAVELLLDQLAGRRVVEQVVLPLRLIIGETCGCRDHKVMMAALGGLGSAGSITLSGPRPVGLSRASMLEELRSMVRTLIGRETNDVERLLIISFEEDLRNHSSERFLPTLELTLVQVAVASRETLVIGGEIVLRGGDLGAWQEVISVLRRWVYFGWFGTVDMDRAEDLLHQARVLIGELAQRAQVFQNIITRDSDAMDQVSHALSSTLHRHEMLDVLERELPLLDIPSCYLALYSDPTRHTGEARLMLAVTPKGRIPLPADGLSFSAGDLLPAQLWPVERRFTMVVEALYFQQRQQGFILLETPRIENIAAQTLRAQISASLTAAELFQHNVDLYNEADRARQRAEQSDHLKSHFLSIVSHELRTPLSLLIGLSEMMVRRPDFHMLPPMFAQDIERIQVSAQHLDQLIRDVLDLASSQIGQLRLANKALDVVDTLRAVAVMGAQLAQEKGLDWQATIPDQLPRIWGDRTRLRQAVLNLVSNAIKFTERGVVELVAYTRANLVIIEIRDTGMGVSLDEQARVFDEFHRASEAVSRGYGGMGLGLAISQRLIELHGGDVSIASSGRAGEGALFSITLPVLATYFTEPAVAGAIDARLESVLILSPPDNTAAPLRQYLEQQGYQIEELTLDTGGNWIDSILATPPGALILNWQAEAAQGWEILALLKSRPDTQSLPVMFYSLTGDQQHGGVVELDLLAKPVRIDALGDAVARHGESSPHSILVVDDEPSMLDMHARAVKSRFPECQVLRAGGGAAAWEIIQTHLPHVVLLDLMMPGMDGFDVLEAMRASEATRTIPVIILTAQTLTDHDIVRLNRGVAAVLGKGVFSLEETLTHLDATLRRAPRLGSEMQRMVRKVMAYIHEHYAEPIAREDMAHHIGVSERYLTRCFSQETGVTPSTYLSRYRINQARKLLETTDISVTEIALEVGFASTSYFGQVFRQQLGVTPQEYRVRRR